MRKTPSPNRLSKSNHFPVVASGLLDSKTRNFLYFPQIHPQMHEESYRLQQVVRCRRLWSEFFQLLDSLYNLIPIGLFSQKCHMREAAKKTKSVIKVCLQGRHHDDTSSKDVGRSSGREVRNDPLAQSRIDDVSSMRPVIIPPKSAVYR